MGLKVSSLKKIIIQSGVMQSYLMLLKKMSIDSSKFRKGENPFKFDLVISIYVNELIWIIFANILSDLVD
jgi:hypothetical protein